MLGGGGGGGGSSGANANLSNLATPTAVNQDVTPDSDNARSLGTSSKGYQTLYTNAVQFKNSSSATTTGFIRGANFSLPSGNSIAFTISNFTSATAQNSLGLSSVTDGGANAISTGDLYLETGNKTGGTGNSGSLHLQTGTSAGGTRGKVTVAANGVDMSTSVNALTIPVLTADPGTPSVGMIWYNSTSGLFKCYNGAVKTFSLI